MSVDEIKNKILNDLHNKIGLCGHCGKINCGGKSTNSILPDVISTDVLIEILEQIK